MVFFAVADGGLDGGAALELALDCFCDAPFLALGVDLELVLRGRIVALVAGVREDTGQRGPGYGFDAGKHGVKRVPPLPMHSTSGPWRE